MVTEVPKRKSLIEPLVITAAVLGIVQGLLWFVLAVIAILFYENVIYPQSSDFRVSSSMGVLIFSLYLDRDDVYRDIESQLNPDFKNINIIIQAKEFNYFMYLYMVLSFGLLIISSVILWAAIRKTSEKYFKLRICLWTVLVSVLSLLDLILMCLIAHDYGLVFNYTYEQPETKTSFILAAMGIVMTVAARGYVLWIINVIFIVILGKRWYHLNKKGTKPSQTFMDAFSTGERPPWDLNSNYGEPNRTGFNNKGFRDDNDNPNLFSTSQSFTHLPQYGRENSENKFRGNPANPPGIGNFGGLNNNWNKRNQGGPDGQYGYGGNSSPLRPFSQPDRPDGPNQWGQPLPQRTAKIGRQPGQRSPPLNVNPPNIPDPDYSPPGSPKMRGVLRPKTNYAMY